jgi:hypothetical protein
MPGLLSTLLNQWYFGALAARPDLLAGHRAGVAADALVEIQDFADLRPDLHLTASTCSMNFRFSESGRSRQSTSFILRMMTNSSRFEPTVP